MILSKSLILELLLLILTKLILEYGYIHFVYPIYEYSGFKYDLIIYKYILGWIVYLLGYGLLYLKKELYIFEIYLLIFLVYLLPNIVYYSLSNQDSVYFFTLLLPYFSIVLMTTNRKILTVSSLPNGKVIVLLVSMIIVISVSINYFITTGGKIVLSFHDVYEFRDEFDAKSTSGIFGYLNGWATKIFVVVLLAWSVYKKNLLLILFSIAIVVLLFALSGHKGVLQSIFLVLFFYVLFKFNNTRVILIFGFLFLISFVMVLTISLDLGILGSLIIRRLLFVPANLNFVYFDFFSQNDYIYWSNSILKNFINYPYDVRAVQVIGTYLGKPDMAANTGFIASGFMHAGYLGVIIYTAVSILLFNIINYLASKVDKYFILAIVFLPISALFVSSDMLTVYLTHGLLIAVLVLWMYDNKEYNIKFARFQYKV